MADPIKFNVNGKEHVTEASSDTPLLYILRNELELNGPKFGCGLQQCGACMVLRDGEAVPSCRLPISSVAESQIRTLEGLIDKEGNLHRVQQAFIDEQAAQCGYCLSGMVMSSVALLEKNPSPSDEDIRKKLAINICRCGVHSRVIKAIKRAASNSQQ